MLLSSIDWAEAPVEWLARGRETSSDVVAKVATRVSLLERRFGVAFQERTRRWNGMAGRCRVRSVVVRRCSVAMWCVMNECMRSTAKEWITDSGLAALKGRQSRQTDRQTLVVRTATGVVWKGRQWNAWTETALALRPVRS